MTGLSIFFPFLIQSNLCVYRVATLQSKTTSQNKQKLSLVYEKKVSMNQKFSKLSLNVKIYQNVKIGNKKHRFKGEKTI